MILVCWTEAKALQMYILKGTPSDIVLSQTFTFSLGILRGSLHDFSIDAAIILIPWKVFSCNVEILCSTLSPIHCGKSVLSVCYNCLFVLT